jgi:SAM-dependent methyltransferase
LNRVLGDTCFDHTTLAALSDLTSGRWKTLFSLLEQQQSAFLTHEGEFRSANYKWPRDALHNWSRIWEYPFAYHNIEKWRRSWTGEQQPVVVDLGSGVTFFPYAVARLGCQVICTDIEPVCDADYSRANRVIPAAPGSVGFRLAGEDKLPFADAEIDLVYCVSVIEHIPDFENIVREVRRILKPGGLFVVTIDLDLRGDQQIGINEFYKLHAAFDAGFAAAAPKRIAHHADVLTSDNGPIHARLRPRWRIPPFLVKQWLVKPLLGRRPAPLVPLRCAVQGILLSKQ